MQASQAVSRSVQLAQSLARRGWASVALLPCPSVHSGVRAGVHLNLLCKPHSLCHKQEQAVPQPESQPPSRRVALSRASHPTPPTLSQRLLLQSLKISRTHQQHFKVNVHQSGCQSQLQALLEQEGVSYKIAKTI